MRILGEISVYGTKASIDRCASIAQIPGWTVIQLGLARKVPDVDSWCYMSPYYTFRSDLDVIDDEIRDFIAAHAQLGDALAVYDPGIKYAFFTLIPVGQSYEEYFAGVLSHETLQALVSLGVGFQIAPASMMPDAPYWTSSDKSDEEQDKQ